MNKKYKLRKDLAIEVMGKTLFRIESKKSFEGVKKGSLGGFIEKESNLSNVNDAWVYGDARVYGDAWVYDDAWVYGDASVSPISLTNTCKWLLIITDSHLRVGCIIKTFQEWIDWLKTDDEFQTERGSNEFKKIEAAINCAIQLAKLTGRIK